MTEKLLTIKEIIREFKKLHENAVVKVEYNQWLHNHPQGKIQFTISIEDAEKIKW